MNIIIGGDLVPTKSNIDLFEKELIVEKLDNNFKKEWFSADYRIFNLECPIYDGNEKILKFGPNLRTSVESLKGISQLNPNLVLLGNNHILDYGINGVNSTIKNLTNNNINYLGIIDDNSKINKGFIFKENNLNVGIYNICDNEFSVATLNKKGTSGINYLKIYKEIKELKEKCNYLIVFYHGGKEYYRYPTPNLKDFCELLCEYGVDIVICQHSHCIGCMEKYNNSTIIYGQGNFIFDDNEDEYERTSLIVKLFFSEEKYDIKYIPIEKEHNLIKVSTDKNIIKDFLERNKKVNDLSFLQTEIKQFSSTKINMYMCIFRKNNFISRIINKFIIKNYYIKEYNDQELVKVLNIIECDAHRELIINAIKNELIRRGNK